MSRSDARRARHGRAIAAAIWAGLLANPLLAGAGERPRQVTTATFEHRVVAASEELPVVVEFFADWCGYCKKLQPTMEKLAQIYDGRVQFVRVDADRNPALARRLGVEGLPTIYIFDGGQPRANLMGVVSRRHLQEMIEGLAAGT